MHRRDGWNTVGRRRRTTTAAAIAALLALGAAACKETARPVLTPAAPSYAEDTATIIRLEDLRVLRDAPDSPRDLTAIATRAEAGGDVFTMIEP